MTHARTLADVGRLPLSRRDRAALVLAYECLRSRRDRFGLYYAGSAVNMGGSAVADKIDDAIGAARGLLSTPTGERLLRARLALLLRVILRVDEDWLGPTIVSDEVARLRPELVRAGLLNTRPMRPLWERAPKHGGGR